MVKGSGSVRARVIVSTQRHNRQISVRAHASILHMNLGSVRITDRYKPNGYRAEYEQVLQTGEGVQSRRSKVVSSLVSTHNRCKVNWHM